MSYNHVSNLLVYLNRIGQNQLYNLSIVFCVLSEWGWRWVVSTTPNTTNSSRLI